jgi:transcriptional regulator with XRE-family HTH domain
MKHYPLAIDYKAIGLRLKTIRQIRGIDVREVAGIAGVSERSWRAREGGGRKIQTKAVLKICHAVDCSIDWLVCGRSID